jgi:glycine cleavage system transcriptional repressor
MANRWIVTALGKDQPGIVAGVTQALYQLGCNLEDSAMTRLEGEFAVMLIFSAPAGKTEAAIRKGFAALEKRMKLVIHLKALTKAETGAPRKRGDSYLISVYGADKPGIVFRVSEALAKAGVNITDVHTHRSAASGPSLYMLLLEVERPPSKTAAALERTLQQAAKRLGVEVSLRPSEADVL